MASLHQHSFRGDCLFTGQWEHALITKPFIIQGERVQVLTNDIKNKTCSEFHCLFKSFNLKDRGRYRRTITNIAM